MTTTSQTDASPRQARGLKERKPPSGSGRGVGHPRRMPQLGLAIFVVIVLNGVFAFAQEYRAARW